MVNPKCSNEAVARNLIARRDEMYNAMLEAHKDMQGYYSSGALGRYTGRVALWQRACQDVRDFRQLHPSAFVFESEGSDRMNNTPEEKTFEIHWLDGTTETIKGYDIPDAFRKAGYGGGAIRAVDYFSNATQPEEVAPSTSH